MYENILPEKKDELVEFLSSDLFPIEEKTALKIVEKFTEEYIKANTNLQGNDLSILDNDLEIDRKKLGNIIFNDLNGIEICNKFLFRLIL